MEKKDSIKQKNIFLEGEGDNWFIRNKESLMNNKRDIIVDYLSESNTNKDNFLEIGCSNGWRLDLISKEYPNAELFGIDPSSKAINDGLNKYSNIELMVGTADKLPFENYRFSNIIIGICLYLNDRDLLFQVACEVDRVLINNGNLIILDFLPNYPYENIYSHDNRIKSYKMNYSDMFTWHPHYNLAYLKSFSHHSQDFHENVNERIGITVLKKLCK